MQQASRQNRLTLPAKHVNVNLTKTANALPTISELQEKMHAAARRQSVQAFAAVIREREKGCCFYGILFCAPDVMRYSRIAGRRFYS